MAKPKILRDYPVAVWFEAADECECCKSKVPKQPDSSTSWILTSYLEWRINHKPDCPEVTEYLEGALVTEISSMDFAGWEYMKEPFKFNGKEYYPLKSRANIGSCLECGKLIVGVPLIIFVEEGRRGELDFCFEYTQKLKMKIVERLSFE